MDRGPGTTPILVNNLEGLTACDLSTCKAAVRPRDRVAMVASCLATADVSDMSSWALPGSFDQGEVLQKKKKPGYLSERACAGGRTAYERA